jgi:hypothetical protein
MLKRAQGLPVVFLLLAANAIAADLRITDTSGFEALITGVTIDYGGMIGTDREVQGIRVSQGEAFITAKWAEISSLTVTGRDASLNPAKISLEIVLKNGKTVPAALVRKGRMLLIGKSDLGDYSINLEKIRKIVPVQPR